MKPNNAGMKKNKVDAMPATDKGMHNLRELFIYLTHGLPPDFWGDVTVKFKAGVPYLVETRDQKKLGDTT